MSMTELLDAPIGAAVSGTPDGSSAEQVTVVARSRRAFDLSEGRCAVEVVLASRRIPAWRVRLQPASIRLVDNGNGGAEITAHLSARPKYASVPGTAGLFMPATDRSTILTVTASVLGLDACAVATGVGTVTRGADEWPIELAVDVRELDDEHIVAAVRGVIHRRDDLPLPGVRLGIDAALELRRCA